MAAQLAGLRRAELLTLERRRRGTLVAPAVAVVGLALTAAAALTIWHNTASPDFAALSSHYVAQVSLPPGTDSAAYVEELREWAEGHPGSVAEVSIRSTVGYYASCAWLTSWEVRHDARDITGEAQALGAYREAISSPWLSEVDSGGVVANLEDVAAAAGRGDRAMVALELDRNCSGAPTDGIR